MSGSKTPTPGEITIMAAGLVTLIFSFFDFYSFGSGEFSDSASVWSTGLFPVASLMVVFVVVMAAQVALSKFANVNLPDRLLGFTWTQVHLVLGFFAALYALAYLLVDNGLDKGIGFWLILIGSIAALVGAVLLQKERSGTSS